MLRLATTADVAALLRWRNDPVTRHFRDDPRLIEPDEHAAWLDRRQASESHVHVYQLDVPVGNVTFDVNDGGYQVGWIVAPEWRRMGVGRAMVSEALTLIPDDAHVWCKTRADNVASCRLAEAVGFRWFTQEGRMRFFQYRAAAQYRRTG